MDKLAKLDTLWLNDNKIEVIIDLYLKKYQENRKFGPFGEPLNRFGLQETKLNR